MADLPPPSNASPTPSASDDTTKNKQARRDSVVIWLAQVIIPLLLGSLLFTGILEGYKSSLGEKKDIIDSYYRPMRALQTSCFRQHQQLIGKYGELSGNYQLQFNELKHMHDHPEVNASPGYGLIPKAIWSTYAELAKATPELTGAVSQCRNDLFIKYEELALVTGTYDKFIALAKTRDEKLIDINRQLQNDKDPLLDKISATDMMTLLRNLASPSFDKPEEQSKLLAEIAAYAEPVIKVNQLMMNAEQQSFDAERSFFSGTHDLFAREISARQSKSFLSYIF
jgi:hypothetical protein